MANNFTSLCAYFSVGIAFLLYILIPSISSDGILEELENDAEKLVFFNHCSEDLGCFYNGPPFFKPPKRMISLPPVLDLKCEFQLFTRKNQGEKYSLHMTKESVNNSNFNPSVLTVVIIEGFNDDLPRDDYTYIMKKELLNQGDYNIIIYNWTEHNHGAYDHAVANTRSVGALVGNMINFLINQTGADPSLFHLVGHSLGAHVSGHAGERVKNLGRITGLDPAGGYFDSKERVIRLDRSDAQFVDIIHTSATKIPGLGFGIMRPIGHQDFYVNGGTIQPGCGVISIMEQDIAKTKNSTKSNIPQVCCHSRAWDLFIESINTTKCHFQGVACDSYENYRNGNCNADNSTVAKMGFYAQPIPNAKKKQMLFYLDTSDQFPFCLS